MAKRCCISARLALSPLTAGSCSTSRSTSAFGTSGAAVSWSESGRRVRRTASAFRFWDSISASSFRNEARCSMANCFCSTSVCRSSEPACSSKLADILSLGLHHLGVGLAQLLERIGRLVLCLDSRLTISSMNARVTALTSRLRSSG